MFVIVELLGKKSARAIWSSRSWRHLFVFTIIRQLGKKQKENHIFCCHSRAAWPECEGLLELASLVVVATRMGK